MRPITTGLRVLGVVAASTIIALAAPHAAGAEDVKGGGSHGGGGSQGKPKPKPKPELPVAGVESWGFNDSGQLGDGTLITRPSAVTARVPDEVRDVEEAAGSAWRCCTTAR
ncbi:hypothetical protein ACFQZ4_33355 [Catellatospora coxensis]